jgi:predicted hydrocarbon binding protein
VRLVRRHREAGLVGGVVRTFVGKEVKAVETRCNAVGDNTCGIDVHILGH